MRTKKIQLFPQYSRDLQIARSTWSQLSELQTEQLGMLLHRYKLSVTAGDILFLNGKWYVTHSGLLRLANRNRCRGILVQPVHEFCDITRGRWAFKATVFTSSTCKGFVGYGDADPTNVSSVVHGAEIRVAETRAVNRALRKAYGIGICSFEEIGSLTQSRDQKKFPPQSSDRNPSRLQPRLRDRLCQLIRQHQLDPVLVKSYALDFCKIKTLKEASREQIDNFIAHLSDCAVKDKHALLCQLNSYAGLREGAA